MICAEDLMSSPVITVTMDDTIVKVLNRMTKSRIGSVVILNREDEPWGIITETDIVRLLSEHSLERDLMWLWRQPLHYYFQMQQLRVARPEQPISKCIELMSLHRIRRLPILDEDDELVGIVTERDILDSMANAVWNKRNGGK